MNNNRINFWDIWRSLGGFRIKCFKTIDLLLGTFLAFFLPKKNPKPLSDLNIKRLLIIRPGGIGDAVFLLPILRILKGKDLMIDVLCEKRNAQIFQSQQGLTRNIYLYDQWPDLWHILNSSYDAVIDTEQWHFLSGIVSYFIKTERRIGFATRPLRAKLFDKQVIYGQDSYELDNFLKLFDDLWPKRPDIQNINKSFQIPESTRAWAVRQIPPNSMTVFLGASIALRRFSKEQLLNIIHQILSLGYYPVLLGGNDVTGMARQMLQGADDQRILNFVGETSLMESAALMERSLKFIGPDSGLMHLACAVGTPVIAVFGPGNLKKWGPKGDQHRIITENVSCSPCTRFGYTIPTCKGSYHCMKNIKIKELWNN